MNLENQVVNLDLSKRLKELGVKQESYFCHAGDIGIIPSLQTDRLRTIDEIWNRAERYICSAFTASELLEMLPQDIRVTKRFDDFIVHMPNREFPDQWHSEIGNLPDALAKTLINLIENKIIEV